MAGATMKEIQEAAGHKSITMSARYSHLSPPAQGVCGRQDRRCTFREPTCTRGFRAWKAPLS